MPIRNFAKGVLIMAQPVCPECKSKTIVYRESDSTYLCRRCGHRFPKTK